MSQKNITKNKEWKLVKSIKTMFKQLTEPEEDNEIEDLDNEYTNKFIKNLRSIQEKTGTINRAKAVQQQERYRIVNKRSKNEINSRNSRNSSGKSDRGRDD